MAKGLKQGSNALIVPMILFVGLWLTSTVLLVILYTGQEELKNANQRLQDDKRRLISSSEQNSVTLFQQASSQGPTVVGLLEQARADLAELATGEPSDDTQAVRGKLDDFLRVVTSDNLLTDSNRFQDLSYAQASDRLYKALTISLTRQTELQNRVTELEGEVDRQVKLNTNQMDQFDMRAQEMSEGLSQAEKGHVKYREERDQQVASIEQEAETRRRQSDADLTEERQLTATLQNTMTLLTERTESLQDKLGEMLAGPEVNSTARSADGAVITAMAGDPIIYINLGRKDRLTLGLKFAVYDSDKGIPKDGRSKAQIEVVTIFSGTAECRILQVHPTQPILAGDVIANPVYDRSRAVEFVVVGEFDLDHDGTNDANGAAAIKSLVADWGGTISDALTAHTDFVVLGVAPRKPRRRADAGGALSARWDAMQETFDQYEQIVATANTLSIPILPQEIFLNFLGYRTRYAGR